MRLKRKGCGTAPGRCRQRALSPKILSVGVALALAVTLVVVVAALSIAVNSQGQLPGAQRATSPPRPAGESRQKQKGHRSGSSASGAAALSGKPFRRGKQERQERSRPSELPERPADAEQVFGDLRPLNKQAAAVVLSVVEERVLGPVTRCKLTVRVEPDGEDSFEVTTRVAFATPEQRASVKVGTKVPVRYDSEDHRRVVVEMGGLSGD